LIYTIPGTLKLKNITANPHASVNLNADEHGGQVVVFTGSISVEKDQVPAIQNQAYLQKYQQGIKSLQMTPETFSGRFSVPLRFRPSHIRAN
jgi:PPOX class probable F420-dependent enzyme